MPRQKGATLSLAQKMRQDQGRALAVLREIRSEGERDGAGGVVARLESAVYAGTDLLMAIAAEARRLGPVDEATERAEPKVL